MGLKCSQWLDSRKYMRIDWKTNQFVDERPATASPVPADVDAMSGQAAWYLTGRLITLIELDTFLLPRHPVLLRRRAVRARG